MPTTLLVVFTHKVIKEVVIQTKEKRPRIAPRALSWTAKKLAVGRSFMVNEYQSNLGILKDI